MFRDKNIYELTEEDIIKYPLWVLPMDNSVDDEFTIVRPVLEANITNLSSPMIIRTKFIDSNKLEYYGYIFWDTEEKIDNMVSCPAWRVFRNTSA